MFVCFYKESTCKMFTPAVSVAVGMPYLTGIPFGGQGTQRLPSGGRQHCHLTFKSCKKLWRSARPSQSISPGSCPLLNKEELSCLYESVADSLLVGISNTLLPSLGWDYTCSRPDLAFIFQPKFWGLQLEPRAYAWASYQPTDLQDQLQPTIDAYVGHSPTDHHRSCLFLLWNPSYLNGSLLGSGLDCTAFP